LEEYDPVADTWARKADMLTPGEPCAAAVNGEIYVIGGTPLNRPVAVEVYDPAADTWTEKTSMRTLRRWLATCVLDGKIYAIGGVGPDYSVRSTVEVYDPATDTWTKAADMPTRRQALAAAAVNGKIYAIGGTHGDGPSWIGLPTVEEYDPATDTWTRKADMPTGRSCLTTAVVNGKVYAIGGLTSEGCLSEAEEYDPATDTWTKRANMSDLRYFLSSAVVDNRIYVMGGSSTLYPDVKFIPTVEVYTPPGWSSSVSPISPQGKLPTTWGGVKEIGETK
jgi:N-acetylneuraminic acid mutarotase